jgi:hypothetical protein
LQDFAFSFCKAHSEFYFFVRRHKYVIIAKKARAKEIIRAWGLNPEEILTRDALTRPNMTVVNQDQLNHQLAQLTTALRQQMLKEIRENQPEKSMNSHLRQSSPGEIRTSICKSKARCSRYRNA